MGNEASSDTKFLEEIIESVNKVREKIDAGAEATRVDGAPNEREPGVDVSEPEPGTPDVIGDPGDFSTAILDAHNGGAEQPTFESPKRASDAASGSGNNAGAADVVVGQCGRIAEGGHAAPSPTDAFSPDEDGLRTDSSSDGANEGDGADGAAHSGGDYETPRVMQNITDESRIAKLSQSPEELSARFATGLSMLCKTSGTGDPLGPVVPVARELNLAERMRSGAAKRERIVPWQAGTNCDEREDSQAVNLKCGGVDGDSLARFHTLDTDYTPSTQNPLAVRSEASEADRVRNGRPGEDRSDQTLAQLLRPLLVRWVDDNLPAVVENALRIESSDPDSSEPRH